MLYPFYTHSLFWDLVLLIKHDTNYKAPTDENMFNNLIYQCLYPRYFQCYPGISTEPNHCLVNMGFLSGINNLGPQTLYGWFFGSRLWVNPVPFQSEVPTRNTGELPQQKSEVDG